MRIPFVDLKPAHADVQDEIDSAIRRVLSGNVYILGPELEQFEAEFAAYCGSDFCIGVSNGLDALTLILRALGVGPGDEVIVPGNTFIATWLAVSHVGATPVPVEPNPLTYNIDPSRVADAVTSKARCIIAVHLYGQPADMDGLEDVARKFGLPIIEDAAQAQGATYKARKAGALGIAAAFSFYPTKNLGAFGDAGAITTSDSRLATRLKRLRNYGSSERYVNSEIGFNNRLDELQAAVLRVKLRHLDHWNALRRAAATAYRMRMPRDIVAMPEVDQRTDPVWHLMVVRTNRRAEVKQHLTKQGIGTLVHYPIAPHLQQAYRSLGLQKGALPITEQLQEEVISLPMWPHLDADKISFVCSSVNEALKMQG